MSENDALDLAQERPARVGIGVEPAATSHGVGNSWRIGALREAPAKAAHPNTYPDAYPLWNFGLLYKLKQLIDLVPELRPNCLRTSRRSEIVGSIIEYAPIRPTEPFLSPNA
jgi:hypothetical protein